MIPLLRFRVEHALDTGLVSVWTVNLLIVFWVPRSVLLFNSCFLMMLGLIHCVFVWYGASAWVRVVPFLRVTSFVHE